MKDNVLYALFHRKKGQILALALLLALLVAILCGCDEEQKAKANASTDTQKTQVVESAGEPSPDTVEPPGEPLPDTVEPAGEPSPEGEFAAQAAEGGAQTPEGEFPAQAPEAAEPPAPPVNDEVIVKFNGISTIINEINAKVQSFDDRLIQISNAVTALNRTKGGVSTPVFIVCLLLVCGLSAGLTVAIVTGSFNRKFKQLEEQIREQRVAANRQMEDLQAAVSEADSQEALDALAVAINQYTNTVTTYMQGTPKAPKAQTVPVTKNPPTQAYYQVLHPRSSADMPTLQKSETRQPIKGWVSSPKTLCLEPALNNAGQCSRDSLYSEQMMACFTIQPSEPFGSADFYTVTIVESAQAVYENGQYVLSTRGRLTARK